MPSFRPTNRWLNAYHRRHTMRKASINSSLPSSSSPHPLPSQILPSNLGEICTSAQLPQRCPGFAPTDVLHDNGYMTVARELCIIMDSKRARSISLLHFCFISSLLRLTPANNGWYRFNRSNQKGYSTVYGWMGRKVIQAKSRVHAVIVLYTVTFY